MSAFDTSVNAASAQLGQNKMRPPVAADPLAQGDLQDPLQSAMSGAAHAATVFRKAVSEDPGEDPEESFGSGAAGDVSALPFQSEMEASFGRSFSDVTVHLNRGDSMKKLGALAATQGKTIVFAEASPSKETVAHELAHVVQADGGAAAKGGVAAKSSNAEQEADAAAKAVANGEEPDISAGSSDGTVHLKRLGRGLPIEVPDYLGVKWFQTVSNRQDSWGRSEGLRRIDSWLKSLDDLVDLSEVRNWLVNIRGDIALYKASKSKKKKNKKANSSRLYGLMLLEVCIDQVERGYLEATGADPNSDTVTDAKSTAQTPKKKASSRKKGSSIDAFVDKYNTNIATPIYDAGVKKVDPKDPNSGTMDENGTYIDINGVANGLGSIGGVHGGVTAYRQADNRYDKTKAVMAVGENVSNAISYSAGVADNHGAEHAGDIGGWTGSMAYGFEAAGGLTGLAKRRWHKEKPDPDAGPKTKWDKREKTVDVLNDVNSIGQATNFAVNGFAQANGADEDNSVVQGTDAASHGFKGVASGLDAVNKAMAFKKAWNDKDKDLDAMTAHQKTEWYVARSQELLGTAKGTANAVKSFAKMMGNKGVAGVAGTIGTAAGVVMGGIEAGQGLKQMSTATKKLEQLKAHMNALTITEFSMDDMISDSRYLLGKVDSLTKSPTEAAGLRARLQSVISRVEARRNELRAARATIEPLVKTMEMVQKKSLASGQFKLATGLTTAAGGMMALSGLGAPIVLVASVMKGLIKLGAAGRAIGRQKSASRIMDIASRLGDDGQSKSGKDEKQPSFRTAESRVESAYYRRYDNAILNKKPGGLTSDEWAHVNNFVHLKKRADVPYNDKTKKTYANVDAALNADETNKRTTWGAVYKGSKKVKERRGFLRTINLTFTFDANRSAQAVDAKIQDMAEGIVDIAMGSYNAETNEFVPTEVKPDQPSDEIQVQTAKMLLENAGITPTVWAKIWESAHAKKETKDPKNPPPTPKQALVAAVKERVAALA